MASFYSWFVRSGIYTNERIDVPGCVAKRCKRKLILPEQNVGDYPLSFRTAQVVGVMEVEPQFQYSAAHTLTAEQVLQYIFWRPLIDENDIVFYSILQLHTFEVCVPFRSIGEYSSNALQYHIVDEDCK